jgi:hypothetical protein
MVTAAAAVTWVRAVQGRAPLVRVAAQALRAVQLFPCTGAQALPLAAVVVQRRRVQTVVMRLLVALVLLHITHGALLLDLLQRCLRAVAAVLLAAAQTA